MRTSPTAYSLKSRNLKYLIRRGEYRLAFFFLYMYTKIDKLASAIKNHVDSGLRGFHTNNSLSLELIGDEVVSERLSVLKAYILKGILPVNDLYVAINCIPVDCKNIEKCRCKSEYDGTPTAHFEIPQLLSDFGAAAIGYIGSTDK